MKFELDDESRDLVDLDPTELSAFGLEKFIKSPPPVKRSKILLLSHLYCQIAYPGRVFSDNDQSIVLKIAQKAIHTIRSRLAVEFTDAADTLANIFEGPVCIENHNDKSIRLGAFRRVKGLPGFLFGHTQRWRSDLPDAGRTLIREFKYPEDGNVFYWGSNFDRQGVYHPGRTTGWKERQSVDHKAHLLAFLMNHRCSCDENSYDQKNRGFAINPFDESEAGYHIATLLNFEVDLYDHTVELMTLSNAYYDPKSLQMQKVLHPLPKWRSRPEPEPMQYSERLNQDIETAHPLGEKPFGRTEFSPIIFRKLLTRYPKSENIFDRYGWSVR